MSVGLAYIEPMDVYQPIKLMMSYVEEQAKMLEQL